MIRIGTLFSGIGAPEVALQQLGISHRIEFACDNDPHVKGTYLTNHNCKIFYDDLCKINSLPKVDVLIFGFPCQPFSLAGKRQGIKDVRGKLLLKALDLIEGSKPNNIIAENVEGLIYQDNGEVLAYIVDRLRRMGYYVQYSLLNALDFGLPQNRKRLWIVATKSPRFTFPEPERFHFPLSYFLDRNVKDKTYATDDFLSKCKVKHRIENYNKDYINCITHTIARNGSSSEYISYIASVYRAIGEKRKPTITECLRLFGFPSSFVFPETVCTTRRYEMLGNSMAVPVLRAIITNVLRII